jgi:hypothetical protein
MYTETLITVYYVASQRRETDITYKTQPTDRNLKNIASDISGGKWWYF